MSCNDPEITLRVPPYDSDRPAIEQLIKEGLSDEQIANKLGFTKALIRCRRERWKLKSGLFYRAEKRKEDIIQLWKSGYLVKEIARILGISVQTVYTVMDENKIWDSVRLDIDAPAVPISKLSEQNAPTDRLTVVTHNRVPKWVLIPVEDYQDLKNGVYDDLRN
ncbi:helix-turn-helix domain-containing protein [Alteromonas sp. RKMC-009]|uniref:helix-turn-helix domain-containing protein n=1 Tax=Alteromonas sp. RKMC-009 TaxID=2267264 RepID=UPI000E68CF09|nr:helix-turn-helix domain-containing protein [Alteromonas sp. RKMC-009]AYA64274.1 helix-turn-helix domain-containing protein [Alteromonas sp. RKMC-009]